MSTLYTTLNCFVPGIPCTKGSWKIRGKHLIPDNKGEKLWAESVGWGVKVHRPELVKKPRFVVVTLLFRFPKPKRPTYTFPTGDGDKLVRSVLDAMKGIAYDDDVQVKAHHADKEYVQLGQDPGVHIIVEAPL